ncbi:unnamed protein product [Brassica rapa subsp. trilocularis]
MVGPTLFHRRKHSWPPEEFISKATLQLLDFDSAAPPSHAWRRRLNCHANILKEFTITFREAIKMVRLGIRLWSYVREEASHGRKAPIDPFTKDNCRPSASQGVPLGGMGSGSISRGFRGEFKQWQITPGTCDPSPMMSNQFSIFISRENVHKKYASVLAPGQHGSLGKSRDKGISSWGWNLNGQHSTYHALFPRAWTIYDGEPDPELKISCRQISPFIPNNYRDSSLPAAVFVYTLVNTGKERAKVSLVFTWAVSWHLIHFYYIMSRRADVYQLCILQNSIGGTSHMSGGHVNEPFIGEDGVSGVLLHHKTCMGNPPVTFAICACETQNVNVTVLPCFGLSEDSFFTAKDMWETMEKDGKFDQENFNSGPSMPSSPGDTICAAVSASAWVEAHGKCTVSFALSWPSPKVKFSKGSTYDRRYTKFYGTSRRAAVDLVHDALTHYKRWEEEIEAWQNPILRDDRLPEWYKFTLFNELYFLVAGGTVWIDSASLHANGNGQRQQSDLRNLDGKANGIDGKEQQNNLNNGDRNGIESNGLFVDTSKADDEDDVGRFLYLEGVEYVMWNTYDVHFYASYALLMLFPKIELNIQRDFAKAVLSEDTRKVKFLAEGNWGIRKVRGAVPHDLGMHDPWNEMNAYNIHDTSKWKDLNPKFVLQVYRDFAATGDHQFGIDVWPAVRAAMEYMEQFDRDNDDLIENDGFPDQTYDTWTVHGVSAYCGCLWLAALQAAAAMALQVGDKFFAELCKNKFLNAKAALEAKLWNGTYLNYDSGASSNSKSIQTDQLAGQWYTASSGLPPVFEEFKIRSTLQKIFDFNVMKTRGGRMGAVNGMHPDGKVDETCMQSREIWTGVTYAAAATMILSGMEEQGFTTAEGIFTAGWSEEGFGYWFQTPEGWTMDGHYRSLIYMRPLAIWGMQWALTLPKAILDGPKINMVDRVHMSPRSRRFSHNVKVVKHKAKCFGNCTLSCSC